MTDHDESIAYDASVRHSIAAYNEWQELKRQAENARRRYVAAFKKAQDMQPFQYTYHYVTHPDAEHGQQIATPIGYRVVDEEAAP